MCQMRIGKAKSKLLCLKYCIEGNLEGGGDGFPNTSRVLVEYGHSLSINFLATLVALHFTLVSKSVSQ